MDQVYEGARCAADSHDNDVTAVLSLRIHERIAPMFSASADLYNLVYSGFKGLPRRNPAFGRSAAPSPPGRQDHPRRRLWLGPSRAATYFSRHLNPNGVALVEPWFEPGSLEHGRTFMHTAENDDVKVCRMSVTRLEPAISHLTFQYLIARGGGIARAGEEHTLGLFSKAELLRCFNNAGLTAEFEEQGLCGRGLYVARQSTQPRNQNVA